MSFAGTSRRTSANTASTPAVWKRVRRARSSEPNSAASISSRTSATGAATASSRAPSVSLTAGLTMAAPSSARSVTTGRKPVYGRHAPPPAQPNRSCLARSGRFERKRRRGSNNCARVASTTPWCMTLCTRASAERTRYSCSEAGPKTTTCRRIQRSRPFISRGRGRRRRSPPA